MRKQLSKSDIVKVNREVFEQLGPVDFFDKKDRLVLVDYEHVLVLLRDGVPLFFYHESRIVPTLKLLLERPLLKRVVVDMGAVKFVTNGADVMRPGITELDHGIQKGEFVVVADETHKKPLAVCEALLSGEEIFRQESGKVLRSVHFVGDKLWNFEG